MTVTPDALLRALRPDVRARLVQLDALEQRARRAARARWRRETSFTSADDAGWLLSYLDIITLLLVMLIALLGLDRAPHPPLPTGAVASASGASPLARPGEAGSVPGTWAPARRGEAASAPGSMPLAPPGAMASVPGTSAPERPGAAPPHAPGLPGPLPMAGPLLGTLPGPAILLAHAAARTAQARAQDWRHAAQRNASAAAADRGSDVDAGPPGAVTLPPASPTGGADLATGPTATGAGAGPGVVPSLAKATSGAASPDAATALATAAPATRVATPPLPTAASLGLADLGDDIDVIVNAQSVSFRISAELLFASGQADLTQTGPAVLDRLGAALGRHAHALSIEGHTDLIPIQNGRFASNWELSTARATSVLRYLVRRGIAAERLRAVGYAHTRPLASNDTPQGRAANRRVELIMDMPQAR